VLGLILPQSIPFGYLLRYVFGGKHSFDRLLYRAYVREVFCASRLENPMLPDKVCEMLAHHQYALNQAIPISTSLTQQKKNDHLHKLFAFNEVGQLV